MTVTSWQASELFIFHSPQTIECPAKRIQSPRHRIGISIWSLAMTGQFVSTFPTSNTVSAISPHDWREFFQSISPFEIRGRREDRVRAAPAVSCANCTKKRTRAYRFSGSTPAFPAQWFYGL